MSFLMMQIKTWRSRMAALALGLAAVLVILAPLEAQALPSFARQTGQNCVACHAGGQFPELTPFGRMFKLTGYTIGERTVPLSVMGVAGVSSVANTSKSDAPDADFQGGIEGEIKGRRESVLAVLKARGLAVSDEERAQILAARDVDVLDGWIVRATTAATTACVAHATSPPAGRRAWSRRTCRTAGGASGSTRPSCASARSLSSTRGWPIVAGRYGPRCGIHCSVIHWATVGWAPRRRPKAPTVPSPTG